MNLPNTVWIYWHQGWDQALGVSTASRRSWQVRNPEWEVRHLDGAGVEALLGRGWDRGLIPANQDYTSRSNFVRLELLYRYGGVWVDATTFSVIPLSAWLEPHVNRGFFAFSNPGPDRLLSTWFLAACPGHPMVEKWRAAVREFWLEHDDAPLHWVHRVFRQVYETDADFARTWDGLRHIGARHPLHFAPSSNWLDAPPTSEITAAVEGRVAPVAKLTNRANRAQPQPGTLNAWLCDTLSRPIEGSPRG